MKNSALPSVKMEGSSISVSDLKRYADGWFMTGEIAQHSPATLANRRLYVRNLLWFLQRKNYTSCGVSELRAFFAYFNTAHKEPGGRWGNPHENTPVKPSTIATYHRHIGALLRWIVAEGGLEASPLARIPSPVDRADQIEPFTEEQVHALLAAAKRSRNPRRDEALIQFLFDTGIRAAEVCDLRFSDVDMTARRAMIREGKGGKARPISFGKVATKALWQYLKEDRREAEEPVFISERGDALTPSGLLRLIKRLGASAQIHTARCSPHTFRHTFAVSFLRNGGNQMSLMAILGHTDLKMTARYVKLAQADVERQHQQFSPADNLKGRKK